MVTGLSDMPEDNYSDAPLSDRLNKSFESLNRVHASLGDIKQTLAVLGEKFSSIDSRVTDLSHVYRVLNEHHIDVEKDLNNVKLCTVNLQNDMGEVKRYIKESENRYNQLDDKIDELNVSISAVRGTIITGLAIVGGILGIVVFVLDYIAK